MLDFFYLLIFVMKLYAYFMFLIIIVVNCSSVSWINSGYELQSSAKRLCYEIMFLIQYKFIKKKTILILLTISSITTISTILKIIKIITIITILTIITVITIITITTTITTNTRVDKNVHNYTFITHISLTVHMR